MAARGGGFINQVKIRPDGEVLAMTTASRNRLPDESARHVQTRGTGHSQRAERLGAGGQVGQCPMNQVPIAYRTMAPAGSLS